MMNKRRRLLTISAIIGLSSILIATASLAPSGSASFVSPLVLDRPTLPAPDYTLTPVSHLPAVMMFYSPLATPTVRPTPP